MKYHELDLKSNKSPKRVGRGISAGQGKTAGRGTKGQRARTGKKLRPGFEGGQNPLMMRLPKLGGFRSLKPKAQVLYTGSLDSLTVKKAGNAELEDAGLIVSQFERTKLIVKGEVTKAISLEVQAASATAIAAVEKAGGTVTIVERPKQIAKKTDKKSEK